MTSGVLTKIHVKPGDLLNDYDLVATLNVFSLTNSPEEVNSKMLLEIQENMIVGKLFNSNVGSEVQINTPIMLLCENKNVAEEVINLYKLNLSINIAIIVL